jgi:hypothetical protein
MSTHGGCPEQRAFSRRMGGVKRTGRKRWSRGQLQRAPATRFCGSLQRSSPLICSIRMVRRLFCCPCSTHAVHSCIVTSDAWLVLDRACPLRSLLLFSRSSLLNVIEQSQTRTSSSKQPNNTSLRSQTYRPLPVVRFHQGIRVPLTSIFIDCSAIHISACAISARQIPPSLPCRQNARMSWRALVSQPQSAVLPGRRTH